MIIMSVLEMGKSSALELDSGTIVEEFNIPEVVLSQQKLKLFVTLYNYHKIKYLFNACLIERFDMQR